MQFVCMLNNTIAVLSICSMVTCCTERNTVTHFSVGVPGDGIKDIKGRCINRRVSSSYFLQETLSDGFFPGFGDSWKYELDHKDQTGGPRAASGPAYNYIRPASES